MKKRHYFAKESVALSALLLAAIMHPCSSTAADTDSSARAEQIKLHDGKTQPVYNSAPGSSLHYFSSSQNGGGWFDLPRPDESWASLAGNKDRKPVWNLTAEDQLKILNSRANTATMLGSFYEFNNALACMHEPFLMTTSVEVSKTPLQTVHVADYKPTQAELFESMARQTGTSIKYNPTFVSKWISAPPAMPLPFSITVAEGWKLEDRGLYAAYIPQLQPFGLDIYMFGRYSGLSAEKTREVRNANAIRFAKQFDQTIKPESMKELKVGDCDALYYETTPPHRPDGRWRQWSLVKNGEAFVIVSAIQDKNASVLVPQVQNMVASFHVSEPAPESPGII